MSDRMSELQGSLVDALTSGDDPLFAALRRQGRHVRRDGRRLGILTLLTGRGRARPGRRRVRFDVAWGLGAEDYLLGDRRAFVLRDALAELADGRLVCAELHLADGRLRELRLLGTLDEPLPADGEGPGRLVEPQPGGRRPAVDAGGIGPLHRHAGGGVGIALPATAVVVVVHDQAAAGRTFTPEQMAWLEMIRDQIATSLAVTLEDFDYAPFHERGGVMRAYRLFGEELERLVTQMNDVLAA